MFSYFGKQYNEMAFTPDKDRYARRAAAKFVSDLLADYLQGREKGYAVEQAIKELEALFHAGAVLPVRLIRQGLACEDEDTRAALFVKAMDMITQQVHADLSGMERF
ncbi:hypothetical protein [Geminicoccus roseus]|uniref:hypothetical protein n=1 Tax=Geminicoccus roseus TaxID=404900 RepID=UPI0012F9C431|nr:hypothetical protein [Geminicoccus roseus]